MRAVFVFLIISCFQLAAQIQSVSSTDLLSTAPVKLNYNFNYLSVTKVARFSGAGAPGSFPLSVLGDIYQDMTGMVLYRCWALTGSCNGVSATNWVNASSGGSGSGVTTFNGRANAVTPLIGDYSSFFLTGLTGDGTANPGATTFTLATVNTAVGACGDSTHLPVLTLNAKGLVTNCVPTTFATGGTVTSVALTVPAIFSVSGSPITSSGTLAVVLATQNANLVWAGPSSGGAATPTFRSLVVNDIPTLNQSTTGNAATATALASTPSLCSTGSAPTGILANGNATGCATVGTVTSVALTAPSIFSVSGSPITSSGTLAVVLANQTANTLWAGPSTGAAAAPAFRALVSADIPNNAANTSGNAATATALASTPSLCSTGNAPTGILANGNATGCAAIGAGGASSAYQLTDAVLTRPSTTEIDLTFPASYGTVFGAGSYVSPITTLTKAIISVSSSCSTQYIYWWPLDNTLKMDSSAASSSVFALTGGSANITVANYAATGYPQYSKPIYRVKSGCTVAGQWEPLVVNTGYYYDLSVFDRGDVVRAKASGGLGSTYTPAGSINDLYLDTTQPIVSATLTTPILNGTVTTSSNCSSAASPAVCAGATAGSVTIAASATTVVVNTTAVTGNSQIFVIQDDSLGTKLGVTCYTAANSAPRVTARVAATSFTITATAPATNPGCYSYWIIN